MEATLPGKTKCLYIEDNSPKELTEQINKILEEYIVLDIKYIQNYQKYGAYIIYLTKDGSGLDILAKEYEMGDQNIL